MGDRDSSGKNSNRVSIIAGGDIGPLIDPPEHMADLVRPILDQVDFRVAQCDRTYSERGFYQEWKTIPGGGRTCLHPKMASIFKSAGIDLVSLASNHALDWGYEPLFDTIELFRSMGIHVIGAGHNSQEARRPYILQRNGVKVAILAYCSILRDGQAAGTNKPGISPMRASTYYHPVDFQPGSPPRIITVPEDEDLIEMKDDIRRARKQADAVIVILHWGIRWIPKTLANYQQPVAHAAIDAGADIIIGHHSHIPKAIEVYKNKVCFYSIGNFLMTRSIKKAPSLEWNLLWFQVDPDSLYGFPSGCERAILPKIIISNKGIERVSFLPVYINKSAQPVVLNSKNPMFNETVDYMEWVSDYVPHKFRIDGDEVIVEK
ncbi:CapA family protein [Thermodesulfobacteriota bacterium]